jgi:hypothetical protein
MREKQWRCQNKRCGAVLGMIRWNQQDSPTLMMLRHSIDMSNDVPAEVEVFGPLIGQVSIRCESCDHVSFWDISVEALAELILGLRQEQLVQLQARVAKGRVRKVQRKANRARI